MRILLLTIICIIVASLSVAQPLIVLQELPSYEEEWDSLGFYAANKLPASGLRLVNLLYEKAKEDNNWPQEIKATLYELRLLEITSDDNKNLILSILYSRMNESESPKKEIYASYLADYLSSMNTFYARKQFLIELPDVRFSLDFSNKKFISREILRCMQISLANESLRQYSATCLDRISDYVTCNDQHLRPSIWDVLAFRAIDVLKHSNYITDEHDALDQLKANVAFLPLEDYLNYSIEQTDTLSRFFTLVSLYQRILQQAEKNGKEALADADLSRLVCFKTYANSEDLKALYIQSLVAFSESYRGNSCAALALVEVGKYFELMAELYREDVDKYARKEAVDWYRKTIEQYPNTSEADYSKSRISYIETVHAVISTEVLNLPHQSIPVLVTWQNAKQIKISIYKIDQFTEVEALEYSELQLLLASVPKVAESETVLPDMKDYRLHTTEVALKGLGLGRYLVSLTEINFQTPNSFNRESFCELKVTELAFLNRSTSNGLPQILVLNRNTGAPVEQVSVSLFSYQKDQMGFYHRVFLNKRFKTNMSGLANIDCKEERYLFMLSKGGDTLISDNSFGNYSETEESDVYDFDTDVAFNTEFYLDRKIYRPGQTIYFKALCLKRTGGNWNIERKKKVRISIYDNSNVLMSTQVLTTNDFGSCDGHFVAPLEAIKGTMSLMSDLGGSCFFYVEEYKRPTFEVVFDTIRTQYKLNDTIIISGNGLGFDGSVLHGAQLKYKIFRSIRFYNGDFLNEEVSNKFWGSTELSVGRLSVNKAGKFDIPLVLLPDSKVEGGDLYYIVYTVNVEVTDLNGETQSGSKNVFASNNGLYLSLDYEPLIDKRSPSPVKIVSLSFDNTYQACEGSVEVWSLKQPKNVFVNRLWDMPDTQLIHRDSFEILFPNFSYNTNQQLKENWAVNELIATQYFNTKISDVLFDGMISNWEPGNYKIKMTARDTFGQLIEVIRYLSVFDSESAFSIDNKVLESWLDQSFYEPKDTVHLLLSSSVSEGIFALVEVEKNGTIVVSNMIELKGQKWLSFVVEEADRGNFFIHVNTYKYNRVFKTLHVVEVPWTNKTLKISYESFRSKLEPGQVEKWSIRIKGSKNEKVEAEVLAAMYDESLDNFIVNDWELSLDPIRVSLMGFDEEYRNLSSVMGQLQTKFVPKTAIDAVIYRKLISMRSLYEYLSFSSDTDMMLNGISVIEYRIPLIRYDQTSGGKVVKGKAIVRMPKNDLNQRPSDELTQAESDYNDSQPLAKRPRIRKDLDETVFFMPSLRTGKNGDVVIEFKMKESLTRWKLMLLAHSEDLKVGISNRYVSTSKSLMVKPNPPRCFRMGDELSFGAKVVNLNDTTLVGKATLSLFDADTNEPLNESFGLRQAVVPFIVNAKESVPFQWVLLVPTNLSVKNIKWRVVVSAGDFSDGEENVIPLISNQTFVTESLPINVKGAQTKQFTFSSIAQIDTLSEKPYQLVMQVNDQPILEAVKALSYLIDYPHQCSEQIFSRIFANSLSATILKSNPVFKILLDSWYKDSATLNSNLRLNEAMKLINIDETPWQRIAEKDEELMRSLIYVFDSLRISTSLESSYQVLLSRQKESGGFVWFPGGAEDYYITLHILQGVGQLKRYNALSQISDTAVWVNKALDFCERKLLADFVYKSSQLYFKKDEYQPSYTDLMYLFVKTMYPQSQSSTQANDLEQFFKIQIRSRWKYYGLQEQGIIAMILNRENIVSDTTLQVMLRSFRERSTVDEQGMYWKENVNSYYWNSLPIETQCVMAQVFFEVAKDTNAVNNIRVSLLANRQTNHWSNSKSTAEAIYVLLMMGDNWIKKEEQSVSIQLGKSDYRFDQNPTTSTLIKQLVIPSERIDTTMSSIRVTNPSASPVYGAVYYQYFQDNDKVKAFVEAPIKIKKTLLRSVDTDLNQAFEPFLLQHNDLKVGDLIKVRLEIQADASMDYVYLSDERAAAFEPIDVLSEHKYSDGLSYYMSTGDVASHFYINHINKGFYAIEYDVRIERLGVFSTGLAVIQCMYAPEFSSHSNSDRLIIR